MLFDFYLLYFADNRKNRLYSKNPSVRFRYKKIASVISVKHFRTLESRANDGERIDGGSIGTHFVGR